MSVFVLVLCVGDEYVCVCVCVCVCVYVCVSVGNEYVCTGMCNVGLYVGDKCVFDEDGLLFLIRSKSSFICTIPLLLE